MFPRGKEGLKRKTKLGGFDVSCIFMKHYFKKEMNIKPSQNKKGQKKIPAAPFLNTITGGSCLMLLLGPGKKPH